MIKKALNFLENFQKSLHFWSKAQYFGGPLLDFTCPIEIIHQILMILHVSIVFELVERGDVIEIPTETPFLEEEAWAHIRDVLLGLEYRMN